MPAILVDPLGYYWAVRSHESLQNGYEILKYYHEILPCYLEFLSHPMDIPELCYQVISHCDWTSLVTWAKVNRGFRRAVQTNIRIHTRHIMNTFFPNDAHAAFWRLLTETKGCIVGGVVMWIMMANDPNYHDALHEQLVIVLPSSLKTPSPLELWKHFLRSHSYVADFPLQHVEPYDRCTKEVVSFTKHVSIKHWNIYDD